MSAKRPEIELEVSCGGTFRIATEEMACRITVIEPPVRGQAALAPAPPPPPEIREVPVEVMIPDPFYGTVVNATCRELVRAVDGVAPDGGEVTEVLQTARHEIAVLSRRVAEVQKGLAADLGKAQAKMADLRFSLTFLKNHPLFSRETEGDADEEVTVTRGELVKLFTKITSGVKGVQACNEAVAEVRAAVLAASDADHTVALVNQLAGVGGGLAETAFALVVQHEAKKKNAELSAAAAAKMAADRLEQLRSAVASSGDDHGDAGGQDLIDQLMGGDDAASSGGDQMSDEEALAKLKEFGL